MSTHLRPVSTSPPVLQDRVHSESSGRWDLAVPLGIVGLVILFMIYQIIFSKEDSSEKPASLDGKTVSKEAPIKPEKVLCIIRIFRKALEENPGYDRIPIQVEMIAAKRGQRLDLRENLALSQGEEFVDIASFLPSSENVWIEINSKLGRTHHCLDVKNNPTLYQIKEVPSTRVQMQSIPLKKQAFTIPDYQSNTEYIPLPSFEKHPTIALQQEKQSLPKKKIVISESQKITLDEEYKDDPLVFENHSNHSIVVQIELKHAASDSFLLSYSIKPHNVISYRPKFDRYLNKPPQPVVVPLDQIIKDYQAAYKIKHRKELDSPQLEDFSIISFSFVHYQ